MGKNRIEQTVDEIFEFIESCKPQPLSSNSRIIVPKDELYELLDELMAETPDELKRYRKVISNREAIISDAERKAASIIEGARDQVQSLVGEHEIMQQAYQQANEMISQASEEANRVRQEAIEEAEQIRRNALDYTNELLEMAENALSSSYEDANAHYGALTEALKANLDVVRANRIELGYGTGLEEAYDVNKPEQVQQEDDYDFEEDTFTDEDEK